MTNDEINRRVAEIEGWTQYQSSTGWYWARRNADGFESRKTVAPPYATDWAWCGPLVEKYHVDLTDTNDDPERPWIAWAGHGRSGKCADTPKRAICLAVIAAHEKT